MKSFKLAAGVIAAASLVAGCSTPIETKKIDYRNPSKENEARSLEVPPDLTSVQTDANYSIPQAGSPTAPIAVPGTNAAAPVLPAAAEAHIERNAEQRWLVVNRSPEQVWPVVQEFWKTQGFVIASENPVTGILETDWNENRAKLPQDVIRRTIGTVLDGLYSTGERDKFRTRLEKGSKAGTTEIYITHRGMVEVYENANKDRTVWQPRKADPELEAEMLALLMQRFGGVTLETKAAEAEKAKADAVAAATAPLPEKADTTIVADNLVLNETFDRAWRKITLALDRTGFTVVDRDRLHGLFYIRYADPESKKRESGWAGWFSTDKTPQAEDFRLEVTEAGAKTSIRVLDKTGKEDHTETGKRILQLLNEQLK